MIDKEHAMTRADSHNNPTAFTVAIALQAGLKEGEEFTRGDPFPEYKDMDPAQVSPNYVTARLLGDPITLTIRVIDQIGFYNHSHQGRWNYITIPQEVWMYLPTLYKAGIIAGMYNREGGVIMRGLFPRSFIF